MMQYLRRNMKWIFAFVAVCFIATIFFVWGMGKTAFRDTTQGAYAIVNGQEITEYEFDAEWNKVKEAQAIDDSLPEFQVLMYKKQILSNMITEQLIKSYIAKSSIKLNKEDDSKLKTYIRLISQYELKRDFKNLDDRSFNFVKQRAVQMLLQEKLGKSIVEQSKVSDTETREEYFRNNEKRKFRYAAFYAKNFIMRSVVKPEEISKYYNDKKESFKAPARYKVQYILGNMTSEKAEVLFKSATEKKDLSVPAKLNGFSVKNAEFSQQELVSETDFETSEEIKKIAKDLSIGEISKPVKVKKGYLILRYTGSVPEAYLPLEVVKQGIEAALKSEKALPYAEMEAEKVFKLIKEDKKSFEEAVKSLPVVDTNFVKFEESIKGVENVTQFNMAGFALIKPGDISKLVKSNNGYYLIKLLDIKSPTPAQFEKEKDKLKETLVSKKQKALQYEFIAALKISAKIVDNSEKVFRQEIPAVE